MDKRYTFESDGITPLSKPSLWGQVYLRERPAFLQHHLMVLVSRASSTLCSQLHHLWTVPHCSFLSNLIHLTAAVNLSSQAVTPQPLQWLSFCLEGTFPRRWSSSLGPVSLKSPLLSACWFSVIPKCVTISPGICPSVFIFSSYYWCQSNTTVYLIYVCRLLQLEYKLHEFVSLSIVHDCNKISDTVPFQLTVRYT